MINKRSAKEAHSEVSRELGVRRRCYARWVADGKITDVDATDRMERMERALDIIERAILLEELNASQPAQPPLGKTVRVEGFNKDTTLVIRGPDESEDDWHARVDRAQLRADAGLSPELVT